MKYHKDYISTKYLAPYTTPVGPSGIGKSFTVAQLAYQHGVYVIYSSLAPEGSLQYPERSAIADILPLGGDKETQINFWRSHLIIALSDVDVCRRVGISPGAFYKLQTMNAYYGYQQGFAKRVSALFDMYKTRKTSQKFDQSWYANVNKLITDNTKSLEFWKRCLEKRQPQFLDHSDSGQAHSQCFNLHGRGSRPLRRRKFPTLSLFYGGASHTIPGWTLLWNFVRQNPPSRRKLPSTSHTRPKPKTS